ncbi:V-type ATP synthase subunit A [Methyloversatilis sp. XJ19-13]|uniref:V-type ATP synthase subunit A n=1 Tax=Methyloversatilis sp. XJ19-13 TaxID=2963430 RepID=UPI00211BE925|nr:V-type ATP synthase subunit A [Methyloversatilis sp. XJ19-13]MCQ9376290.1 V-type ATP synthase subunit A [Methyloversatilis sp. XJ19-13]
MNRATPATPQTPAQRARATVTAVRPNLVTVQLDDGPVARNEVGHVCTGRARLKAEVLRVRGRLADMQVFEDTRGVRVGDKVELSGELLSVTLGPGLLTQVFDGLQNPLDALAAEHGVFLPRGHAAPPLPDRTWSFEPVVREGVRLWPGDVLGHVMEGRLRHDICVPFDEAGPVQLGWLESGRCDVHAVIGEIRRSDGSARALHLAQRWPVRRPLPQRLLRRRWAEQLFPHAPLLTTIRLIDSFFPIARGGTACIPGPFGAGKTVLQNLIARFAAVDVVIIVACGERAGEVVETLTEFPQLQDPRTGGSLMDRTVIVCNTSAMPVAARESSIYTGVTMGEYYRHMGYDVLVIADSTSRWAQAMRETSGRMEEIPGEEAYPGYLDSSIRALYERAGIIRRRDGIAGSLTLIGTVSPAGGNLEEPVTQATLASVKTFLGLTAERAYRRCYPAIDPLRSWSRYHQQLRAWQESELGPEWPLIVERLGGLLRDAQRVAQMVQVTGEEGITEDDYLLWQRAELIDNIYLQQDAFDPVDVSTPLARQREMLVLLAEVIDVQPEVAGREALREWFLNLTALLRDLNCAATGSGAFLQCLQAVRILLAPQRTTSRE